MRLPTNLCEIRKVNINNLYKEYRFRDYEDPDYYDGEYDSEAEKPIKVLLPAIYSDEKVKPSNHI